MDPSCGHCLGSDCRGDAGYTDPECPEHGTAAKAAAKAAMDLAVKRLNTASLRKLVRAAPRRERTRRLQLPQAAPRPGETDAAIRKLSERMVEAAQSRRRLVKLFELHGFFGGNPERAMTAHQREVFRYFNARVTIAFREIWREHTEGDYEVWATW